MKVKVKLDFGVVCHLIPEAEVYPDLPRKKKKKLKKYISDKIVNIATDAVLRNKYLQE